MPAWVFSRTIISINVEIPRQHFIDADFGYDNHMIICKERNHDQVIRREMH